MKRLFFLITVFLILVLLFSFVLFPDWLIQDKRVDDFFVGVSFCGDSFLDAKLLVDRVKFYTNLLVVQSGPASKNQTMLNEICDYAVEVGLSIIVYFGKFDLDWQPLWLDSAENRWGSSFLGVYFFDEPAGSLLDSFKETWNQYSDVITVDIPQNSDEMAELFVSSWQTMPGLVTVKDKLGSGLSYTSDYALYWFDYLAGYDVVFAEFGWNHSRIQDIALVRGAARVQDKEWGAIVTWTFNDPPYLEDGERLYEDLLLAYENGAKYFVVFNYPEINDYGILTGTHFSALERFWQKIQFDDSHVPIMADSVLVLPKNYGYGMRRENDTVWGLWEADEKSVQIWNVSRILLSQHAPYLDIVYEDDRFSLEEYFEIFYWNATDIR
ncbi:hypothetical protein AC477_03190 [miscellaneous Crenarchaeota group-1 archaeon SG8-32-1]|uniref:Glycoside hydrolase family 42 N-terminal domain-containing protein n=1 Tax=miscellaneous Crenarchaeota group-1 archaeon SG8-32-1 TaxID=1685124 RepID=A0A0M0BUZ2_9ARCH|nr:MAG: hypothetical protein AC477_03190 [miscellaneous Crenarchaeota group-1 archaeon SG8-32-1]